MAKKFYAVKVGKTPGIYTSWEECKNQTDGYPNADFKGFSNEEAAREYIGILDKNTENTNVENKKEKSSRYPTPDSGKVIAYVDGSFDLSSFIYSYGVLFLYEDKQIVLSGIGADPEMATMRNVAGEILGASVAMKYAYENNISDLTIYHDYQGISSWCTGEWQAKKTGTKKYANYYRAVLKHVNIHFKKVKGHSGNICNDIVDGLAKRELGIDVQKKILDFIEEIEANTK